VTDSERYVARVAQASLQAAVAETEPAPVHRARGREVNERKIAFFAVQLLLAAAGKGAMRMIWTNSLQIEAPRARVPDGVRVYAIGDVHGRVDLLDQVLSRVDVDLATHPATNAILVFLGDYIDRGPASKNVLDRLIACCATRPTVCLIGNHETYVSEFLKNPEILSAWRQYGGLDTLLSYGIMPSLDIGPQEQVRLAHALDRALPSSHRQFLNGLRPYFVCGDFFFVHAGVRPGIPLTEQSEEDLLWIREDFLHYEHSFGKVIVHGHTPVSEPEIRANRISIDTGAYATGRLTCLVLEGDDVSFI
jgi:serine/threonine protein phosphatase 1